MTVERYPAVRVSEGVLPAGRHLFVPLEWADAPDKTGFYWAIGGGMNEPVWYEWEWDMVYAARWKFPFDPDDSRWTGARWLWLGELQAAAEREAKE